MSTPKTAFTPTPDDVAAWDDLKQMPSIVTRLRWEEPGSFEGFNRARDTYWIEAEFAYEDGVIIEVATGKRLYPVGEETENHACLC